MVGVSFVLKNVPTTRKLDSMELKPNYSPSTRTIRVQLLEAPQRPNEDATWANFKLY